MFSMMSACALLLTAVGCSARYDVSILKGGAADIRFSLEANEAVMKSMAEKAALFTGEETEGKAMTFDVEGIRAAAATRKDVKILSLEEPDAMSLKGRASVPALASLGADGDKASSFFSYQEKGGVATLAFKLDRGNAAGISDLLIGLDRDFIELLAPPALYGDEITEEEYAQSLVPFIGKKDLPVFQASNAVFRLTAPGKVVSSSGGKLEGNALVVTVPAMRALVLEKPIEFSLSWKI